MKAMVITMTFMLEGRNWEGERRMKRLIQIVYFLLVLVVYFLHTKFLTTKSERIKTVSVCQNL